MGASGRLRHVQSWRLGAYCRSVEMSRPPVGGAGKSIFGTNCRRPAIHQFVDRHGRCVRRNGLLVGCAFGVARGCIARKDDTLSIFVMTGDRFAGISQRCNDSDVDGADAESLPPFIAARCRVETGLLPDRKPRRRCIVRDIRFTRSTLPDLFTGIGGGFARTSISCVLPPLLNHARGSLNLVEIVTPLLKVCRIFDYYFRSAAIQKNSIAVAISTMKP